MGAFDLPPKKRKNVYKSSSLLIYLRNNRGGWQIFAGAKIKGLHLKTVRLAFNISMRRLERIYQNGTLAEVDQEELVASFQRSAGQS